MSHTIAHDMYTIYKTNFAPLLPPASAVVDAINQYVMSGRKAHIDDTPVRVPAQGHEKTKTGQIRVYVRDNRSADSSDPGGVVCVHTGLER